VNSLQLLLANGIQEAQLHISQQITPQLVSNSWLVLTMEQRQRDFLHERDPFAKHKIFTLNEIVGESGDITDPYGSDLESYKVTYAIIEDRIKRLIELIKQNKIYS
ncbi:MAG: protein tyrosine phosphatase, partial [Candidatus Cloacimonadaceae bacterium]|nr:protein tyrosine phosphatase [Candidatus Cloacimonadaceae bacterium]